MKKILAIAILLLCVRDRSFSQNWFRDMYDPAVNFFTVRQEFDQWWAVHGAEALKNEDGEEAWNLYKSWEYNMLPRMYATHGLRNGAFDSAEYRANLQTGLLRGSGNPSNWVYTGPQQAFQDYNTYNCKGRLNCVRFDPVDTGVIYGGAPGGGVWRTINQGQSWQLMNTDFLATIGVTDLAINPMNNNTLYTATGDYPSNDAYCLGVYKSTDAGQSWQTTGLSFTSSQGKYISRLLINQQDTNIILVATTDTVYISLDAGNTWPGVDPLPRTGRGMAFKPGDPQVVYAYGKKLYRSVNAGSTWSEIIINGLDSMVVGTLALAVTPAAPNNIYVMAVDTSLNYIGLFISDNMGNNFYTRNKPATVAGQAPYDLTLGVSPIDTNYILAGDVDMHYSTNGGTNWHEPQTAPHVDNHDFEFYPHSNTAFSCNDGGLFISTDTFKIWAGIDSGLNIGELYNVSSSNQTHNLVLTCRQDDGQKLLLNTTPCGNVGSLLADGTNCLIDPTNDSIMYFSRQNGFILKSTDGGYTFDSIVRVDTTGVNSLGSWVCPFLINPQNHNSLMIAKDSVYKSVDGGATWHATNFPRTPASRYYVALAIAPGDTNIIYAIGEIAVGARLYQSLDGGNSYADITGILPLPIEDIAVSYNDPGNVWVAAGNGVYHSVDSGAIWNIDSAGLLQGYTARCLAVMNTPLDPLYVGFWGGPNVYYTNDSMGGWIPYSNGLPTTHLRSLDISEEDGVIRAATYGRDVWQSPLYDAVPTGIAHPAPVTASVKIWPNPNNGDFNISLESNEQVPVAISVFDILGNMVYQCITYKNAPVFNYAVANNNMTTGIYLVKVSWAGNVFTQRVAVSR